jgi:hypothetical protein
MYQDRYIGGLAQKDQKRRPNGLGFRLRRVTWKSTPSNQGCLLLVGPLVPRGSFTPVSRPGPAAIRHPWRGAALAASMPLGPLRETCVQPAPKSRLVSSGRLAYEDQDQDQDQDLKRINSFPAEAGPTVEVTANPTVRMRCRCRTGFSREAFDLLSLLAFGFCLLISIHRRFKHRETRLGCRPNADDAQWAERHGCRESAVRTWMSVRRGPTERRRSEGTRRSRAKPGAKRFWLLLGRFCQK